MTARQQEATEPNDEKDNGGHQPNDLIAGKYCLRHVIGIGGMGTVWAATNLDLDLDVAVKVVNKWLCSDETRARLSTEARAEAKVQHRGIVRVLDLGVTEQGEPFLVMERLEGRSLGEMLDEVGYIESRQAVRIMLPVIEALAYAHGRGVVHRDLKPDNIFLAEQCGVTQPKLVDFGIAKLGDVPMDRRHTGRGAVVGSPGYMAPEHARGIDVDHRADIFCAALVLYEAISGKTAFKGSNYNALLRAVIEQHLEPITAFGRGDSDLSRILERALNKNPTKRHESCLDLGRELATWLMGQGETDDVTGEPLSTWWQRNSVPGYRRTTDPSARAPLAHRPGSSGRPALPSIRGLSVSTTGFPLPRRTGRRLAVLALSIAGLVGGIVATTAFDFFPSRPAPKRGTQVAAASTTPSQRAAGDDAAPTVTPVDHAPHAIAALPRAPEPAPRSSAIAARPAPVASRVRGTMLPIPKAPPTFAMLEQTRAAFGSSGVPAAHVELDHAVAAKTEAPLMLPADPPPPRAGLRVGNDDTELKDPYP